MSEASENKKLTEEEKQILKIMRTAATERESSAPDDEVVSLPYDKTKYPLGLPLDSDQ
ncbi:MAG: hypothetical protein F6J87_13820 [Spirulina sp. SIO3F2]|nr:hypothetical protein [Spirulina sp. SIO3F2]